MTAPTPGARINPDPVVILDGITLGTRLYTGTSGDQTPDRSVAVLDDLSVTWGRARLTDHHEAQTARFRLLAGTGRESWSYKDWRNRSVIMQWTDTRVQPDPVVFFRGRVTEVVVTPRRVHPRTGASRGAVVEFSCTGRLTELGNRRSGVESWPDESGAARLDRIKAIAGGTVASITMRDYWAGAPFAARNVNGSDALSLLRSLYDTSGGDRMTYNPQTDAVSWTGRRLQPATVTRFARWITDPTQGYVAPRAVQTGSNWPMIPLTEVETDGQLTRVTEGGATRVEYSWTEAGAARSGIIVDPAYEAQLGVVQLSCATELRQGDWAKITGGDWLDILWREGSTAQPPPMTYRADKVGGFLNTSTALQLIGARELGGVQAGEPACWFLAGGPWPSLYFVPVVGIIGGTIRYVDGGWRPTFHSQAVAWMSTADAAPLRASQCRADSPTGRLFTAADLSPAVTFADCRYINRTL